VETLEVTTDVHVPPGEAYAFLENFPGYARYSKYLESVTQDGDGTPGTRYDLHLAWWKLSYTACSEVTGVDPPEQIDWKLVRDIHADGHWRVDPAPEAAPPGEDHASCVRLSIRFDPDTADSGTLDLPRLVSLEWVIGKVKPLVQDEAERIVERIVADIEGEPREVDLEIHTTPDSV